MATDYITADGLKATLGITGSTYADADVAAAITSASRGIEYLCERRFWLDTGTNNVRIYTPDDKYWCEIDDLVTLTSLKTDSDGTFAYADTWTLKTDFITEPANAVADGVPITKLRVLWRTGAYYFDPSMPQSVEVTGQFGWSSVPEPIVNATTLLASALLKRSREAPFGVALYGDIAMRIARTDPTVTALIGPYRKRPKAIG